MVKIMTKKEKAFQKSLKNWDKYLLDQYRKENVNYCLRKLDRIIQDGAFQRYYITVANDKNESEMFCHFVFDMCDGINGYFDGIKFVEEIPFYYLSRATGDMKKWAGL